MSHFALASLAFLVVSVVHVDALYASPATPRCNGTANTIPVHTADPVFVRQVPNGKLYQGGAGTDTFNVLHVYGSYYEMGFAHGTLFKDVIPTGLNRFYDWIAAQIEAKAPWVPAWLAGLVADFGVPIALEMTFSETLKFTHQKYLDEMAGIADGAGVELKHITNINMIAELIKAQCSVIGANANATQASLGGGLVHLRTLDGMGGSSMPIKDYAMVIVYHPAATLNEPAVAVFTWVSFVGAVTGFGEFVGIGEKFWGKPAPGSMSTQGEAWTFVTRDVLSSWSFDGAVSTLLNANRTCAIHLGIGGRKENRFFGAKVDEGSFTLYTSQNQTVYAEHPRFDGIVYWDKYSQPTTSFCFADLFAARYGSIDAEYLALTVAPMGETGDLHAAIFDYQAGIAFFSNARKTYETSGSVYSYNRMFTRLNMTKLFAESL